MREQALALPGFHLVETAVSKSLVGAMRSVYTQPAEFRRLVHTLTGITLSAALRDATMEEHEIRTPMGRALCQSIVSEIALVPVLRAGLGMMFGALNFFPTAQVFCLGMYRCEESLQPVPYYNKFPKEPTADIYVVLDIMLATGGSVCDAIEALRPYGKTIKVAVLIAAPEGVIKVHQTHPDVEVFAVALDQCLNEKGYIVPGLGDAGDRYFNTPFSS